MVTLGDGPVAPYPEALDPSAAVVAKEVVASNLGNGAAPVHEASGDGAAVTVGIGQQRQTGTEIHVVAGFREPAVGSLVDRPPEVHARFAGPHDVHFLERALAHIGDVQIVPVGSTPTASARPRQNQKISGGDS